MPASLLPGAKSQLRISIAAAAAAGMGAVACLAPSARAQLQLPQPTDPDQVIANLRVVHEKLLSQDYAGLLHEDFVFYFSPADVDLIDRGSSDRVLDEAAVRAMLSGATGTTPGTGEPVPPVEELTLSLLPETADWEDDVPTQFAGTLRRPYRVNMRITFAGGASLLIGGMQDFYVAPVEVDNGGGETVTEYRLKYWVDNGVPLTRAGGCCEVVSWGWFKGCYLSAAVPGRVQSLGALKWGFRPRD